MPELPEIETYLQAIETRMLDQALTSFQVFNIFALKSVSPSADEFIGKKLVATCQIAKRVVLEFEEKHFAVIHLMLAGEFRWTQKLPNRTPANLAVWSFADGHLLFREASKKHRASIHLFSGEQALKSITPPGIDVLRLSTSRELEAMRSK